MKLHECKHPCPAMRAALYRNEGVGCVRELGGCMCMCANAGENGNTRRARGKMRALQGGNFSSVLPPTTQTPGSTAAFTTQEHDRPYVGTICTHAHACA